MFSEHRKFLRPLLPAQPLPKIHVQHDDPHLSSIKPPTPATTPLHHMDSHVLPSWPNPGPSIWRDTRIDATSLRREYWAEHEVIQFYYCPPVFKYHTWMPPRDHAIPSLHHSHEAHHPLEAASVLCMPPPGLCLMRRIESEPMSNTVERTPGTDFSTMQTINPALVFPNASKSIPETFSCTGVPVAAAEACPITSDTGISSTRLLDPPQENAEIVHDTAVCMNDPSLLDCHLLRKQPVRDLDVEDPEFDMHKRKFDCPIIGCRKDFKRQDHLERHTRSHSKEKPHVCWVPGCRRAFSRRDNLKVHCTKTHTTHGGRNRYVATLDQTSPYYDPGFRGQLSFDGFPLRFPAPSSPVPEVKP
ncbi:hypothetical protein PENFLA_c066G06107 [Penicillium flavigenum]|uniref:C2H2-type domain-containing protein n=1 Tax=Penicillium flavigenum TaxID=254877 RepID=A0A1V6SDZ8_9EURO|nr:hypothetical protein PENFLA_c066G06107 [Penicillium flavigenum]